MPSACRVSVTQGGLTTLMRIPRGASSAAARAKPSSPAFTRLIAALPRDGCWARMPLVSVIEPPSTTEPSPRSEEHTSELQSQSKLVCRLLLEKKKNTTTIKTNNHPSKLQSHTKFAHQPLPDHHIHSTHGTLHKLSHTSKIDRNALTQYQPIYD